MQNTEFKVYSCNLKQNQSTSKLFLIFKNNKKVATKIRAQTTALWERRFEWLLIMMVRSLRSILSRLGFEHWLLNFLVTWPWTSNITLFASISLCKFMINVSFLTILHADEKIRWVMDRKVFINCELLCQCNFIWWNSC